VAHHVNSRQRSTSVAFGAKQTLTEQRLQKRVHFERLTPRPAALAC
jgi:hypothetical protein